MRYFLELAYNGTRYNGYQIQPKAPSIQKTIQDALTMILREKITIIGCGRTDTGVHALQYYAHFDTEQPISDHVRHALNGIIVPDIVVYRIISVPENAHARFDAMSRSYVYYLATARSPFRTETAYYCPFHKDLDSDLMQEAANLLLTYDDFTTFCKTKTDTKTKLCDLRESYWDFEHKHQLWTYHVTANRFLRGMIRLIVGMCINVGRGRVKLDEVRSALATKTILSLPWSVPAKGLYLTDIEYKFLDKAAQQHA